MRTGSTQPREQSGNTSGRSKKRRQFIAQPARLQLDDYMLTQIKRNKHSVKTLKKEVNELKHQVKKLQEQHDDYLIFQKSKTQDQSRSQSALRNSRSQRQALLPLSHAKCNHKIKTHIKSKESSILSKSSSAKSSRASEPQRNAKKGQIKSTKQRLSRKIQELKAHAQLQEREKQQIKKQVERKIKNVVGPCDRSSKKETPTRDIQQPTYEQGYQQLLELLKTNKSISSQTSPLPQGSPKITHFQSIQRPKQENSVRIEQQQKINSQRTAYSTDNFQLLSSHAIAHIYEDKKQFRTQQMLKSQTNLLDSSPSVYQSPKRPKRALKLSRCFQMNVRNEPQLSGSEGSGMQGIFEGVAGEMRSGTMEMSFEGRDNSKRRLRELQFEFDQLVRQQLLSSDPHQKEMLSQTIRSLLTSIADLKDKMARERG